MSTRVNTTRARRRLSGVRTSLPKMARNALNDTVRDVSRMTPDILREKIDKPTPYTLRKSVGLYDRTNEQQLRGRIFMGPQKAFLSRLEFGGSERNEIIPTGPKYANKYGNIPARFYRSDSKINDLILKKVKRAKSKRNPEGGAVGRFFIGKPRGGDRHIGIYERGRKTNKWSMVATFMNRDSDPQLGLRDEWKRRALLLLPRHWREQKRRSLRRP